MKNLFFKKSFEACIIILIISSSLFPITSGIQINRIQNKFENIVCLSNDSDFDQNIHSLMNISHIPSISVAIVKNNSVVWSRGYGFYDLDNQKLANNETIYMAGSISKSFTATAILQLYEQGLIDIDCDASKYLGFSFKHPKFPDVNITLRMLLSQTSGIAKNSLKFVFYFRNKDYTSENFDYYFNTYDPGIWLNNKPGTTQHYSNIGFDLLGFVLEKQTGQSIEEYCQESILQPLGMTNSSFHFNKLNQSRLAIPYVWIFRRYIPLLPYDIRFKAAGGLHTTVLDLSRFMIAHMNSGTYDDVKILNATTARDMHKVHSKGFIFDYGLGWIIWNGFDGIYQGHGGCTIGFEATMKYKIDDNTGLICFWNQYLGARRVIQMIAYRLIERAFFEKAEEL